MGRIVQLVVGGALLALAPFGGFTVSLFGYFIAVTGAGAALIGASLILSGVSKFGKPNPGSLLANVQGRTITVRQPAAARRVILGQALIGGVITFAARSGANNEYFHMVVTLSGHEVQEVGTMYFDGVEVPLDGSGDATGSYAGRVHVEKNLGTSSQAAFAGLAAAGVGWESTDRQRGCAGVYVRLLLDSAQQAQDENSLFPTVPPNINFLTKGAKFYNPVTLTTAWSNNAAVVAAGYLTDSSFGLGASYARRMDESDLIAAVNVCEEAVALNTSPTTYENRYTINGVFDTSEAPGKILEQMALAMAGAIFYSGGRWHIMPGAYTAPALALDEQHFIAPLKVTTLRSKRDLANGIKGTFVSPVHGWTLTDFPAVYGAAYLAADGERSWKDIQLPFTVTATMAQRIAKILLEQNRREIGVSSKCSMAAYQLRPFDTVGISFARYGWAGKVFQVASCQLALTGAEENPALALEVAFQETDADVYAWDPATDEGSITELPTVNLRPARIYTVPPLAGTFAPPGTGPGTAAYRNFHDLREILIGPVLSEEVVGGSAMVEVFVNAPAKPSVLTGAPLIGEPTTAATGGDLPGDQTLYYAIAATDAGGVISPPSVVKRVDIPAGTNTNTVTLNALEFDAAAATFMVFRGRSPQTLVGIGFFSLATSWTDDNQTSFENANAPVASEALASVQMQWRRIAEVPYGPIGADIFGPGTIGYSSAGWTVDQWEGYVVEIVRGAGWGQRRVILSNTANTLTVAAWNVEPNGASVFAIHHRATGATATTITDSVASWEADSLNGLRVRIIHGPYKALYQERTIIGNTATTITVDSAWDSVPLEASPYTDRYAFELVGFWQPSGIAALVYDQLGVTTFLASIQAPNEPGIMIEYTAIGLDRLGRPSDPELISAARYCIVGGAFPDPTSPILLDYAAAKQISGGPEMLGWQSDVANRVIMGRWVGAEVNARVLEDCQGNREWKGPDPDCDQNILMGWAAIGRLSLQGVGGGGLSIVAWKHTYLNGAINASQTTYTVTNGAALGWTSGTIRGRIENEIVYITNVTGNTVTSGRGNEGTTAAAHASGLVVCRLGVPEAHPRILLNNDGGGILFSSGAVAADCRLFRGAAGIFGAEVAAGLGGGFGILEVGDNFHKLFFSGDATVGIKFGGGAAAGDIQLYRVSARRLAVIPLVSDGTEVFQILTADGAPIFGADTANGRVGVGTAAGAPAYTLDVGGDLFVNGAVTLNNVLAIVYGGTGAATAATARDNLGVPAIPVATAEGGTGATTVAAARANLSAAVASGACSFSLNADLITGVVTGTITGPGTS